MREPQSLRIGIDVGGTNTDAAVMSGREVLSSTKAPTSPDVITGIIAAVTAAGTGHDLGRVDAVVIGTTHFINAIVSASGLVPVVALRLCTDDPTLGPFTDWPTALAATVNSGVRFASGGHQFDGRLLNALDEDQYAASQRNCALRVAGTWQSPRYSHRSRATTRTEQRRSSGRFIPTSASPRRTKWAGSEFSSARTPPSSTSACGRWRSAWSTGWWQRSATSASMRASTSRRTTAP